MPNQQRYINKAMNADETEQKILQLAKAIPADERVPSGFAMRVMSDVREIHTRETSQADEQFLRLARNIPANEHVPYAFEKRIMAHVRALLNENPFTIWSRMLWRAVAPCLGVMLLAIVLAFGRGDSNETEPLATVDPPVEAPDQNAIDFETVLLASFDDLEYTW